MPEPRRTPAASKPSSNQPGDVRPIPDPTLRTIEDIQSAIEQSKEYTDMKLAVIKERLNGIDTAAEVLHETVTRLPTDVQVAVSHLRELTDEKFMSIEKVLDEQRRGLVVAEQEREKSAAALRIELGRQIEDGDGALHAHVAAQIAQVEAGLISADALERERIERVAERIDAEKRIQELTRQLGDTAILKAEVATAKQFDEFSKTVTLQMDAMRLAMQDITRRMDKLV